MQARQQKTQEVDADLLFRRASGELLRASKRVLTGKCSGYLLSNAESLIDALPLATESYASACVRLRNADRSAQLREYGAAAFELNLLARSLESARKRFGTGL